MLMIHHAMCCKTRTKCSETMSCCGMNMYVLFPHWAKRCFIIIHETTKNLIPCLVKHCVCVWGIKSVLCAVVLQVLVPHNCISMLYEWPSLLHLSVLSLVSDFGECMRRRMPLQCYKGSSQFGRQPLHTCIVGRIHDFALKVTADRQ